MKIKIVKLTDEQAVHLSSIVVPRWVRDHNRHAAHIWFEVFVEYLDRLGYTVIKKESKDDSK